MAYRPYAPTVPGGGSRPYVPYAPTVQSLGAAASVPVRPQGNYPISFQNGIPQIPPVPGAYPAAQAAPVAPAAAASARTWNPGTPAGPNPAAIQPFLSPEQQAALDSFDLNTGYSIAQDERAIADAQANTAVQMAAAQRTHDVNTDMTNQGTGARGIFQSSIRSGDLADIDLTMSLRQSALNTSLQQATDNANAAIARANTQSGITHNLYNVYSVQNAAAQTPMLPTAATPGSWSGGAAASGAAGGSSGGGGSGGGSGGGYTTPATMAATHSPGYTLPFQSGTPVIPTVQSLGAAASIPVRPQGNYPISFKGGVPQVPVVPGGGR